MSIFNLERISIVGMVIVCLFFTWRAWGTNTDFADGRYCLVSVERIVFDNVNKMLKAPTLQDAAFISMDGDSRYGRGLYNISYVASWIPWRIWGDRGVIVTTRMLQALILLAAYFLLTIVFVKPWPLRVLTVTTLICLPSTLYYATIPKPEPLQFLFLGLFLYCAVRAQFAFAWYYFFLGCALGMKISALILIPFFMGVTVYLYRHDLRKFSFYRSALTAVIGGVIGYVLMQGTLMRCFMVRNLDPFNLYLWFIRHESHVSTAIFSHLVFWLNCIFKGYFCQPSFLTWLIFLGITVLSGLVAGVILRSRDPAARAELKPLLILGAAGIIAVGSVTLFVENFYGYLRADKLIAPFYLHPGFTLLTVAAGGFIALGWKQGCLYPRLRMFTMAVLFLWGISIFFLFRQMNDVFLAKSHRGRSTVHWTKFVEYARIKSVMDSIAAVEGRRLLVACPSMFYQLNDTPRYLVRNYRWTLMSPWRIPFDAILLYESDMPRVNGVGAWNAVVYDANVCSTTREFLEGRRCLFVPVDIGDDKLRFLLRADVFTRTMSVLPHSK